MATDRELLAQIMEASRDVERAQEEGLYDRALEIAAPLLAEDRQIGLIFAATEIAVMRRNLPHAVYRDAMDKAVDEIMVRNDMTAIGPLRSKVRT